MPNNIVTPLASGEANARYRALTLANERDHPDSDLQRDEVLWHRTDHTDLSAYYLPSSDDSTRPLYINFTRPRSGGGGHSLVLRVANIDGHAFDKAISLTLGAPALQTEAEDRKRVIDLLYNLFSTLTLAQFKAMTNDTLRTWLNNQSDPAYRIISLSNNSEKREWSAMRTRYEHDIVNKKKQQASEILRLRSSFPRSPSDAIADLIQLNLNDLLAADSEYTQLLDGMERSMMSCNAASDTVDDLLKIKIDTLLGGISMGVNIVEELPGLSTLASTIDPVHDMILFCDDRSGRELQQEGHGCSSKLVFHRCLIPSFNEKTIAMFLIALEINRLRLAWHPQVDGEIIRNLLGSGTLHRIGYNTADKTYRVVDTYSSNDIIPECASKKFIWSWYVANFLRPPKYIWNID
eukprot:scaffold23225_cov158-Skeletonema_dohrnii-CCMP3373.AAC.4